MRQGFILTDVLLGFFLGALIFLSLQSVFNNLIFSWEQREKQFNFRQQKRIVLDIVSRELRQAVPGSLKFMEGEDEGFVRIEFSPNFEPETDMAFYRRGDNVLKGIKRPDHNRFTGMSIALGVEQLYFFPREKGVKIQVESSRGDVLKTVVFPRGKNLYD